MKNQIDTHKATYTPQTHKTFEGALENFLKEECPQVGGTRSRHVIVSCIRDLVTKFFPKVDHLYEGQTGWTCVHKDEKSSYGKTIHQSRLTHVILDLVPKSDIDQRANGVKLRDLKKEATERVFTQAYEQDGVLTNAEVAIMLKMSTPTVSKYIKEIEAEKGISLPRRGTIHDMGPTLTHKRQIIEKLVFEFKPVEQVCRETNHSPEAVHRYITNFKQALLCRRKGFNPQETAFTTTMSVRLVKEHLALIDEWSQTQHPEFDQPCEKWLDFFVEKLESLSNSIKPKKKV